MDYEILLDCFIQLSYELLISGLEVSRVEKIVVKLCEAYNIEQVDVFTITSSIVVTIHCPDGQIITQTKRIKTSMIQFDRIQRIQEVVEFICLRKPKIAWIKEHLKQVQAMKLIQKREKYFLYVFISCVFSLFFGGTFHDAAGAGVSAILIRGTLFLCERIECNNFMTYVIASAVGGISAHLLVSVGLAIVVNYIVIGNIMLLIPGLAMMNALKDMINGDLLTGTLRLSDSILSSIAIASGFALSLML